VRPSDAGQIAAGEVLYNSLLFPMSCHGPRNLPTCGGCKPGRMRSSIPFVLGGAYVPKGMARLTTYCPRADAGAVHEYLIDQAWQLKQASASSQSPEK